MNPMPSRSVRIELLPLGKILTVAADTPLQSLLFEEGVEFPCGGQGRCKGCRVKVLSGHLPCTPEDAERLSTAELAQGWRLACRAAAVADLKLELAQWEASILSDTSRFEFVPREGLGVAVDLGTTTLVAQLVDLQTADVLGVRLALNSQARHGADIMSRIDFALRDEGRAVLTGLIRQQIGQMVAGLLAESSLDLAQLRDVVLVGNTAMHHLFCGLDVAPLSHYPFEPEHDGLQVFDARDLDWPWLDEAQARFLPCLGGFVGSDILAGILATDLHERDALTALVDLGTNGEIVVGDRSGLLCASTAAGPAFEGAKISQGMRAATGAISAVEQRDGAFVCHVLGQAEPRGICGSGLVDAVAVALDLGCVSGSGRIGDSAPLALCPSVKITQADIRELQLAKGAIAAGIRILLEQRGVSLADVDRVHLAGAFGNYINRRSAQRIGLLPFPPGRVVPVGNTALLGAKLALFLPDGGDAVFASVRANTRHVSLHADPGFQDVFLDEMAFP